MSFLTNEEFIEFACVSDPDAGTLRFAFSTFDADIRSAIVSELLDSIRDSRHSILKVPNGPCTALRLEDDLNAFVNLTHEGLSP